MKHFFLKFTVTFATIKGEGQATVYAASRQEAINLLPFLAGVDTGIAFVDPIEDRPTQKNLDTLFCNN